MKRLVFFIFALFLAACQGNDGGGGVNNTQVVTPLGMSCINGQAYCNNTGYSQYSGFIPYPGMYNYAYDYTNYFNQYGFCNCPAGYQPIYNGSMGLGCINTALMAPYEGFYFSWQWGWGYTSAAPQMSNNFPQYSNIPQGTNGQCSRTLTQSCMLDQSITCGAGATCRPVFSGSNLGVCIQN